jgi:hypothetical protein
MRRDRELGSSDDAVGWVAASTALFIGGRLSRTCVLEDDAVSRVAASSTLVIGGDGSRKRDVLEGIHVDVFFRLV